MSSGTAAVKYILNALAGVGIKLATDAIANKAAAKLDEDLERPLSPEEEAEADVLVAELDVEVAERDLTEVDEDLVAIELLRAEEDAEELQAERDLSGIDEELQADRDLQGVE